MTTRTVEPNWYRFQQNNSRGWKGPAKSVYIEAFDAEHANARAESLGLYFDGVADGTDCRCCGDRWDRVSRLLDDAGSEPQYVISLFGKADAGPVPDGIKFSLFDVIGVKLEPKP